MSDGLRERVAIAIGDVSMLAAADRVLVLLAPYLRPESMTPEKLNEAAELIADEWEGTPTGFPAHAIVALLRGWAREIGTQL